MKPGDIRYWSAPKGSITLRFADGRQAQKAGSSFSWSPALKHRDSILLLYRTSNEVDSYRGIPFWKVIVPEHGVVYCQEANLELATVESLAEA